MVLKTLFKVTTYKCSVSFIMIKNKPFLTSSNTTGNRAYFMSWRINTISFSFGTYITLFLILFQPSAILHYCFSFLFLKIELSLIVLKTRITTFTCLTTNKTWWSIYNTVIFAPVYPFRTIFKT